MVKKKSALVLENQLRFQKAMPKPTQRIYAWKLMGLVQRPLARNLGPVRSVGGGTKYWQIGKWYTIEEGQLQLCARGFHCSPDIASAARCMGWHGEVTVLALVQVKGQHVSSPLPDSYQKSVWRSMRIARAVRWTSADWRAFATFLKTLLTPGAVPVLSLSRDWPVVAIARYRATCSPLPYRATRQETEQRADNAKKADKWLRAYVKAKKEVR